MLAAVELVQRRHRVALEPEQAVGVILDQHQVVALGQLDQRRSALDRGAGAGRVLVGRNQVDEPRPQAAGQERDQAVDVDAVGIERDRVQVGARLAQDLQGAVVGGRLDDRGTVAVGEKVPAQETDRL